MAVGGYKCVSFSWQGGRKDSLVDRIKFVLNGFCDAIISANVGWQYDTLTPNATSFITMPSNNNTSYPNLLKVLTLENNSHTYKIGIGYNVNDYSDSVARMKVSDTCPSGSSDCIQRGSFASCLYFGMVKDGNFVTDSTYGLVWNEVGNFLRWMPFCNLSGINSADCFISKNESSSLYTFYAILKNAQIAILIRNSKWVNGARLRGIVAGEIFKETAHSSDNITFGSFYLHNSIQNEDSDPVLEPRYGVNAGIGYSNYWPKYGVPCPNQVFTSTGEVRFGFLGGSNYTYRTPLGFDEEIVGNKVSPIVTAPGGRWTPCYMLVEASDQNTYGIVQNDGFKGFIDTDLFRGVNSYYTYGQLLGQNSEFIYLGGGWCIGWDSTNTVPLF